MKPQSLRHTLLSLMLVLGTAGWSPAPPAQPEAVPAGFTDALVVAVAAPTALAFTPDGRLLITSQTGQLRVYQNGALLGAPALNLTVGNRVCSNFERGLLGVTVDPNFAVNNYIYLYYTFNKNNTCPNSTVVNRVSRFTLPANNVILTSTEMILVDNIPSINGNHNGGDVHFGADGLLYVSVGDSGTGGSNARIKTNLAGKILRVNADGTAPASNPFFGDANAWRCGNPAGGSGSGPCQEIFAFGLRNPYRFAFRPGTSEFYINDVGQNTWEEIDAGQSGADYGWNCREGAHSYPTCSAPAAVNPVEPLFDYNHTTGCYSITGGAFVPNGVWPAQYDGAYLFTDYGCGTIMRLILGAPATAVDFATGLGSAVDMLFGPYLNTQALYYTTYSNGGQVRRIAYNSAPIAVASANPLFGVAPLTVTLSAAGSNDPDNNPLTFNWNFGDGITTTTSLTTTQHMYSPGAPTVYTATLTVNDGLLTSAPATVRIYAGDVPPTPAITAPGHQFSVGEVLTLTGTTSDSPAPSTPSLVWNVLLHHIDEVNPANAHTHPYLTAAPGSPVTLTAPAPEDLRATALSYLEIQLTAIDSLGLATTITQTLNPNRVTLTFATVPANLQFLLNAAPYTATQSITSWQGYGMNVSAPTQFHNGQWWMFGGWSDGGAAAHTLTTPASSATYTATFVIPIALVHLPLIAR